jgi:hypothetical protein
MVADAIAGKLRWRFKERWPAISCHGLSDEPFHETFLYPDTKYVSIFSTLNKLPVDGKCSTFIFGKVVFLRRTLIVREPIELACFLQVDKYGVQRFLNP